MSVRFRFQAKAKATSLLITARPFGRWQLDAAPPSTRCERRLITLLLIAWRRDSRP
jgi:hypothetical protein